MTDDEMEFVCRNVNPLVGFGLYMEKINMGCGVPTTDKGMYIDLLSSIDRKIHHGKGRDGLRRAYYAMMKDLPGAIMPTEELFNDIHN